MSGKSRRKPIPIYTTRGDWSAVLIYPYIYNTTGEWIGWATNDQNVFDVNGVYVGWLTDEPRILRRKTSTHNVQRRQPPPKPTRIRLPSRVPLAPMMSDVPYEYVDVLEDEPQRLHTIDSGELKEDMD